jgi:cellobiose phosphorylase
MTRGIISELFTYDQALRHYDLIKENLYYSDGVRLMNQPATYAGGVNSIFKRAELASNVGREVGLQYVHAHIRFIEAMAKLGKADEVWHALAQINPILIDDVVKNAVKRQSNCYFSSSDADFATRYEAQEQWGKLKDASVMVRGGWRIYSSGPGIYINQLISNCLGIRLHATKIELDPVICQNMDGLEFSYSYEDHDLQFVYHVEKREFAPKKLIVNNHELTEFRRIDNPYRGGGVTIDKAVFMQYLKVDEVNIIDIYL